MLAAFTGAKRAVAVVNGTAALHACPAARRRRVQDDRGASSPALTFVAAASAIAYCGATPHFCRRRDARDAGHRSAQRLRDRASPRSTAARRKRALRQPRDRPPASPPWARRMHASGHPVRHGRRSPAVARHWSTSRIVEDAAGDRSVQHRWQGRHAGTVQRPVSPRSAFNGNKTVTTGRRRCAIPTDDAQLGQPRRSTSRRRPSCPHRVGFRARRDQATTTACPNLNAALGCAQLEQLDGFLARKRALASAYDRVFADVPGVPLRA